MHRKTVRAALGWIAWCGTAVGLSVYWVASAQQQSDDDPRFTGASRALDNEGLRLSHRWFEAGARSAWHSHPNGQLLFVQEGRARTQQRGGALRELGVGDSDYAAGNVEHWHGAVPDQPLVQVAVTFGGETEWLEKVTDAEYNGR